MLIFVNATVTCNMKTSICFSELKKILVQLKGSVFASEYRLLSTSESDIAEDLLLSFDPQTNTTITFKLPELF